MRIYAEVSVRAHNLRATTVHGRPSPSPSKRRQQTEEILLLLQISCISKNNQQDHCRHDAIIHRAKVALEALASNIRSMYEHDARDFEYDVTLDLCDKFGRL